MIFTIQGAIPPTGTVAETIQPKVTTFNPANGATGIPLLSTITATFSEPVQPSTISTSTFQVKDSGGATVPGTVTMEPAGVPPKVIVFKPSSQLASSKTYSVTITTGVKDLAGNPLASVAKSFFTTGTQASGGTASPTEDTAPPKVVNISPRNGAIGVQLSSPITATFSEPLLVTTVKPGTIYVEALPMHTRIQGNVMLSTDGKTVKFQPATQVSAPWFIVVIMPEIRDLKGNAVNAPVVWAYSTIAAPAGTTQPPGGPTQPPGATSTDTVQPRVISFNPPNGATAESLLPTISATFSEPMQVSTVSTSTFQVKDVSGVIVPGTVTMSAPNLNAVFKPSSQLASSKTYSVTITTGVKDLAGNPLASVAKSFFTTGTQASGGTSPSPTGTSGDTTQLKVVSIKPVDRATGVPITSTIVVTFSKAVLPSSVTTTFDLITAGPGGGVGPLQIPSIVHVPGTATLSTDGKTVTFRPNAPFEVTKTYTYSILGPKDLAGSPLTPNPNISGSFTTGSP
jgi:hypothetical protein